MAHATAKRIGGSMVLELSAELESELQLAEGMQVEIQGLQPKFTIRRRRYNLAELLAQCDYSVPMSEEEREWIDAPRMGRELI